MSDGPSIRVAKAPVFRIALNVVGKGRSAGAGGGYSPPIPQSDVTGLVAALAGKADAAGTTAALNAKANKVSFIDAFGFPTDGTSLVSPAAATHVSADGTAQYALTNGMRVAFLDQASLPTLDIIGIYTRTAGSNALTQIAAAGDVYVVATDSAQTTTPVPGMTFGLSGISLTLEEDGANLLPNNVIAALFSIVESHRTNADPHGDRAYTDAAIAALVGAAPALLDTLSEISDALGDDPNFATTIMTALSGKATPADITAALASYTDTAALTTLLAGKAPTVHTHAQSDITGLTADLGGKQDASATLGLLSALTTTSYGRGFLSLADLAALLDLFTGSRTGAKFLRDDGSWQAVSATDSGALRKADNLSDLESAQTARTNLGVESVSAFYGPGVDGNVTISGTTTLTNDMYYNNLTVNGTLITAGYRVFVAGTLSGNGTIHANGTSASSQSGGTGGGVATNAPFIKGVDGGGGQVGAGSQCAAGTVSQLGGNAGAGGAGASGGSVAGRATSPPGQSAGGVNAYCDVIQLREARPIGPSPTRFAGGNGGTGGSGDGTVAGGGGGGAGGCVVVFARYCTFTGTLSATGGNGATRGSGNVGGGGGGGGGIVALCTSSTSVSCTLTAAGGSPGNGVGTGTAGAAGSAGPTITFLGVR